MLYQKQETIPLIKRDYVEWHRGRTTYGLWLVELGTEEISQKVEAAQEHLSDFLLKPYHRQPHVSIFICGFLADALSFDDDYSTEQLHVHAEWLHNADIKPFVIEVGRLNSFASAPFLEVHDLDHGIERVRSVLSATTKEIGSSSFTPHVTVGLYSRAFQSRVVVEKISTFQSLPIRLTIEQLTFATYDAREIAGALTRKHSVTL
jgi:hypothetical protein